MSNLLHDLRLGMTELRQAKTPTKKEFARRVIKLMLWENRDEILAALEMVEHIIKPRS